MREKHERREEVHFPQSIKSVVLEMISQPSLLRSLLLDPPVPSSLRSTTVLGIIGSKLVLFFPISPDRIIDAGGREKEEGEFSPKQPLSRIHPLSLFLPPGLIYFIDFRPATAQPISPADYQSSKSNNIISLRPHQSVRGPIPFPRAWRNPAAEFMGTPWPRRSPLYTRLTRVRLELTYTRAYT